MDLEGNSVLRAAIPEFVRVKNDKEDEVYFVIHINFGEHQRWTIRRSYKEFAAFNTMCEKKFGSEAVPYFTGSIPFNYRSPENSEKRRGKLEEYVNNLLTQWPAWRPTKGLHVIMPHPDGIPDQKVKVHVFLLEFLELNKHAVVVDRGAAYEAELKRKAEAEIAAAAESAEEQRKRKVAAGEMTEVEAHQARLKAEGLLTVPEAEAEAAATAAAAATEAASKRKPYTAAASTGAAAKTTPSKAAAAKTKKATVAAAAANQNAAADVDCESDEDGFDIIVERDNSKTKESLRKFTSHCRVRCRDYRLIPNSHIEYNFQIAICGATWTVTKRYSEVFKFHESILHVYGEAQTDVLPNFSLAFAPKWDKCNEDVAVKRQAFFTSYFEKLVSIVDRWRAMNKKLAVLKPIELNKRKVSATLSDNSGRSMSRASFLGDTAETEAALNALAQDDALHITVDVNALLYEFFGFEERLADFDADKAVEVQKEKEAALPQTLRVDLERERAAEAAKVRASNFHRRQKERPGMLRDVEIADFARILGACDDDSEALQLALAFVTDGYYTNIPRAVNLLRLTGKMSATSALGGAVTDFGALDRADSAALRREAEAKIGTAETPCCITSRGLAQLIRPIAFDDTKARIVKALARVLSDDVHLSEALDELMYDWDAVGDEVRAVLSKPDAAIDTAGGALTSH